MYIKPYLSRFLALILVAVIGLTGCSNGVITIGSKSTLTGDFGEDTIAMLEQVSEAIDLPKDAPNQVSIRKDVLQQSYDYIARYRRDKTVSGLRSYTTMQTALNALAGYYSLGRPVPSKLKKRLEQQFRQIDFALKRGY